MSDRVRIRPIGDSDWDAVATLESRAYDGLGITEGADALRARAAVSPATCFVLAVGSRVGGYLLALPYPAYAYPGLDDAVPDAVDRAGLRPLNMHLHDIVVAESLRGRGLARYLVEHLTRVSRQSGYDRISLVAVGASRPFWSARGFALCPGIAPQGYGAGAVYMSKAVPAVTCQTRRGLLRTTLPTKRADQRVLCS